MIFSHSCPRSGPVCGCGGGGPDAPPLRHARGRALVPRLLAAGRGALARRPQHARQPGGGHVRETDHRRGLAVVLRRMMASQLIFVMNSFQSLSLNIPYLFLLFYSLSRYVDRYDRNAQCSNHSK